MTTLQLRITFTADWHIGAGYGRPGSIDRLLRRDEAGFPYIPAKTLRGMYRDACERLAFGLDDGVPSGPWAKFVDVIFGTQPALGKEDPSGHHVDPANTPLATRFRVQPAHLLDALRESLVGNHPARRTLREALAFVKPGVKIDGKTGRAADAHLRFEEQGRIGTVFDTTAELELDGKHAEAAKHFLVAAAALIERMGGKRRRGAGECTVEVVGADRKAALTWLEDFHDNDLLTSVPTSTGDAEWPSTLATAVVTKMLPVTIRLKRPVAVAVNTVGNVVTSLDYVPGTYLLPYFTKKLGQEGNKATIRGAIQSGSLQLANATLEVASGRGLPIPFCFFASKVGKFPNARNSLLTVDNPEQPQQQREYYLSSGAPNAAAARTVKVVSTHNVVHDGEQRPNEQVGGVYSYEAIASQTNDGPTVLRSELRLSEELFKTLGLDKAEVRQALGGDTRLGSSKKDDYGLVEIEIGAPTDLPASNNASGLLYVWLESDVLLRDANTLQFTPTEEAFTKELGQELGVKLKLRKDEQLHSHAVRIRRIDSWQTSWGLPRPTLLGLQAGSCFVYDLEATVILAATLAKVQANGLGERRSEGFGRVRFNDPLLCQELAPVTDAKKDAANPAPTHITTALDKPTLDFIHVIEREAWRAAIRRLALQNAANNSEKFVWIKNPPPMSQLGGLRNVLQRLQKPEDKQLVLEWLKVVQKNPRRAGKWPGSSLKNISEYLDKPDLIWTLLQPVESDLGLEKLTLLNDATLRQELWTYAVRAVFDAAIRARKRSLEAQTKE